MPIYEYKCKKCQADFEEFRKLGDPDGEVCCPKCGEKSPERRLSAPSTGGCGCGCGGSAPAPPRRKFG